LRWTRRTFILGVVPIADAAAPDGDELRQRLLAAAARVFAREGYAGTKIKDIVDEAGLSTGAVYGRFRSKNDLLRAAVVSRSSAPGSLPPGDRVADVLRRGAARIAGPLSSAEAINLEACVTARREPEIADALAEAAVRWRESIDPYVVAAKADGTLAPDVDPEAVVYFARTMQLGLLVQRAAGLPAPEQAAWDALVTRLVASFGADHTPTQEPS
jgi:AcrR family transcriptional regulator